MAKSEKIQKSNRLIESIIKHLLKDGAIYGPSTEDVTTSGSMSGAVVDVISSNSKLNDCFLELGIDYKLKAEEAKRIKERDPSFSLKGRFFINSQCFNIAKKNGWCMDHPSFLRIPNEEGSLRGTTKALYGLPKALAPFKNDSPELTFTETQSDMMSDSIGVSDIKRATKPKKTITKNKKKLLVKNDGMNATAIKQTTISVFAGSSVTIDDRQGPVFVKVIR